MSECRHTRAAVVLGQCSRLRAVVSTASLSPPSSVAMDHLILAGASLGLGACWIAAFDPAAAREVLGLPDDVEPIAFTQLGYPADQPREKKRKPLSELVCYERWGG